MPTLFVPHFNAVQQIPIWALFEHAAGPGSSRLNGGSVNNRGQQCGQTTWEQHPNSSRKAWEARRNRCHRQQQQGRTGEEQVNFQEILNNAAANIDTFLNTISGQANSESVQKQNKTEVLSVTMSPETGFEVNLDVSQYSPEDLNVKAVENSIVIEAKHSEKEDGHGFVTRSFTRRYVLPETINAEDITCKFAPNGVLTLTAPPVRKTTNERSIPINFTATPTHINTVTTSTAPATLDTSPIEPLQTESVQSINEEAKLD